MKTAKKAARRNFGQKSGSKPDPGPSLAELKYTLLAHGQLLTGLVDTAKEDRGRSDRLFRVAAADLTGLRNAHNSLAETLQDFANAIDRRLAILEELVRRIAARG